jgi:SAM-dependent methyltransferase
MSSTIETHVGAIAVELRRVLEGACDANGELQSGDLQGRLAEIGVRKNRPAKALDELPHLSPDDRAARRVVEAFLTSRSEAGVARDAAIGEFLRKAAYGWANRLLALRCMEARGLIDEVILQKEVYRGRSLQHHRLSQKAPERCAGEDDGLFAVIIDELERRSPWLPMLLDPRAVDVALRPSVAALKRCVAILSGTEGVRGHAAATDDVFSAPDALGWAYQYWNREEKDRVFAAAKAGAKIGGEDIIPATCIYTPTYMVRFLVQNSLGARWMAMHPESGLCERWPYYVRTAIQTAAVPKKPVRDVTFLDPACGSGHFLLEAFDVFFEMYMAEGSITDPAEVCASILERNLFGIDIDERAIQVAALSLVTKAKEKAQDFVPRQLNLVATNIRLPAGSDHVDAFLTKHPEDAPLKPALLRIFESLAHADELGSLLQIEEPVDQELRRLRDRQVVQEQRAGAATLFGPREDGDWEAWKHGVVERVRAHFLAEAGGNDLLTALFGEAANKGLALLDVLSRRYDIISMNPPYVGFRKLAPAVKKLIEADDLAKQDLYVAFLSRFFSLLAPGGHLAAVSPSSWTTSSRTAALRQKMLDEGAPRIVVALGQRVFDAAPLLYVSLQVVTRGTGSDDRHFTTLRPTPFSREQGLLDAARSGGKRWPLDVIRGLETLPFLPVAPRELLEKARSAPTIGEFFSFADGVWTGSNERDVRESWEVPVGDKGWAPTSGGQGYSRWYAPLMRRVRAAYALDWPPFQQRADALEYARVAGGKLAARATRVPSAAVAGIVTMMPKAGADRLRLPEAAAVFNSRLGTVWLRTLSSGLNFNPGYAGRIPLSQKPPSADLVRAVEQVIAMKQCLSARQMTCDDFRPALFEQGKAEAKVLDRANRFIDAAWEETVRALEVEAVIEDLLKGHFEISDDAWAEVELEMGKPAGALPVTVAEVTSTTTLSDDAEDEDEEEPEARSLPAESDLENLARQFGVHPRRLLSPEGLPSEARSAVDALRGELARAFVADYVSLLVLRLFGHRFPLDGDAPTRAGVEVDEDGIIPLTAGAGEKLLLERVRDELTTEFSPEGAPAAEREIGQMLGKPLERWLETDFFRYHVGRFGKRPVVWQIQTGKYTATRKPTLAVAVYAHRVNPDTLPKIRSQYLGTLRTRLETELRGIETKPGGEQSPRDRERKTALDGSIAELVSFDLQVEALILSGFSCPAIEGDPSPAHASLRRYSPHRDDGVRVNVAPLQRAGLLAAEVLAAKDVMKAITDRATWQTAEATAVAPTIPSGGA